MRLKMQRSVPKSYLELVSTETLQLVLGSSAFLIEQMLRCSDKRRSLTLADAVKLLPNTSPAKPLPQTSPNHPFSTFPSPHPLLLNPLPLPLLLHHHSSIHPLIPPLFSSPTHPLNNPHRLLIRTLLTLIPCSKKTPYTHSKIRTPLLHQTSLPPLLPLIYAYVFPTSFTHTLSLSFIHSSMSRHSQSVKLLPSFLPFSLSLSTQTRYPPGRT